VLCHPNTSAHSREEEALTRLGRFKAGDQLVAMAILVFALLLFAGTLSEFKASGRRTKTPLLG
jgi:hypothetical protein